MTDSSSQQTNEDPVGPLSEAGKALLTLTPSNAAAIKSFSDVVDWCLGQSEEDLSREPTTNKRVHCKQFMWVASNPEKSLDVTRYLRRQETGQLSSSPRSSYNENEAPTTTSDIPTDVWTGCIS